MINLIIKQIWNKRRSNLWIAIELILVTFFMWKAIDPVFVLLSNRAIDNGFNMNHTFCLSIGEHPSTHTKYDANLTSDSLRRENFLRIYDRLRHYQDVTAAVVTINRGYPSSDSYSSTRFFADSVSKVVQYFYFYSDGEFFKVFDIGHEAIHSTDYQAHAAQKIYLTKDAANLFFRGESGLNRTIFNNDSTRRYQVAGVIDRFKFKSLEQPQPLAFMATEELPLDDFPYSLQICFRIRDGVGTQLFTEHFKRDFVPQMNLGNYYFADLQSFDNIRKTSEFQSGMTNTMRLQTSLAVFFLLCTFLGISGTFWLRANSRKEEIGLRISLGSTRKRILKDFLLESWLITTLSWLIGVVATLQVVYSTGFAMSDYLTDNTAYIQNQPILHFLIVSLLVYVFMLAIALIGTWIPANRAAKIDPAEALKDE